MKRYLVTFLLFPLLGLAYDVGVDTSSRQTPVYLMQTQGPVAAIRAYRLWQQEKGSHDFETLQQIALRYLEQGLKSTDSEIQLLSLYGCGMGGLQASLGLLEQGLYTDNPSSQMTAVQFLGNQHDDMSSHLLIKAMSSPFLQTRFEAAYHLSVRKHKAAVGQIESLMFKLPPQFTCYFPELLSMMGTHESISCLKNLMESRYTMVRVACILSAAQYGRDELLGIIRCLSSHSDLAEQEASITALGVFKDSTSLAKMRKAALSTNPTLKLAGLMALYRLGHTEVKDEIIDMAKKGDLFAIYACKDIPTSEETLQGLLNSLQMNVRVNAAMALLERKDPVCKKILFDVLIRDTRDLAFYPNFSCGHSLFHWKVLPSLSAQQKQVQESLQNITLAVREYALKLCIDLPPNDFLHIATRILQTRQTDLVPQLIQLLTSIPSPASIALLKKGADSAGAPLTRAYCNLALLILREEGPWQSNVLQWIEANMHTPMVSLREMPPLDLRFSDTRYQITPNERSRLLIESLQLIAERHEEKGIDLFLTLLEKGDDKNKPLIAGLLLKTLQ